MQTPTHRGPRLFCGACRQAILSSAPGPRGQADKGHQDRAVRPSLCLQHCAACCLGPKTAVSFLLLSVQFQSCLWQEGEPTAGLQQSPQCLCACEGGLCVHRGGRWA